MTSLLLASIGLAISLLSSTTLGAIGPIADLRVVNKLVNLDGFPRQGVFAGGTFPGPVITGYKVSRIFGAP